MDRRVSEMLEKAIVVSRENRLNYVRKMRRYETQLREVMQTAPFELYELFDTPSILLNNVYFYQRTAHGHPVHDAAQAERFVLEWAKQLGRIVDVDVPNGGLELSIIQPTHSPSDGQSNVILKFVLVGDTPSYRVKPVEKSVVEYQAVCNTCNNPTSRVRGSWKAQA